jgi:carboxypeptidase C (cathepsin A)
MTEIGSIFCDSLFYFIVGVPSKFSIADIRPNHGMNITLFSRLMSRTDFIKKEGLDGRNWENCNTEINTKLHIDHFVPTSDGLNYFINHSIPLVFYYGDKDYLCNYYSFDYLLDELNWPHKEEFRNATFIPWEAFGVLRAEYKAVENIMMIRIFNASHIAFYNQPEFGLDMVIRLVNKYT